LAGSDPAHLSLPIGLVKFSLNQGQIDAGFYPGYQCAYFGLQKKIDRLGYEISWATTRGSPSLDQFALVYR
jgi:hypothetical protein